MPESPAAATDLDLISFLCAIPEPRLRRGIRIPAWYLLLVAILGVLSSCQSLRDSSATLDGEGRAYVIRHHTALTSALGVELTRPPSDSAFRTFFQQVDVAALYAAIRDWTIAQIPGGAGDLDQLVCVGKTMRGSIKPISSGGSAYGLRRRSVMVVSSPGRCERKKRLSTSVRPGSAQAGSLRSPP